MRNEMIIATKRRDTQDMRLQATLSLQAADSDAKQPSLSALVYNGGVMAVWPWGPVAIDLEGLDIPEKVRFLADHEARMASAVGHGAVEARDGKLYATGTVSKATKVGRLVADLSREGFPLEASVGVKVERAEEVQPGATVGVNGGQVTAPGRGLTLVRQGRLQEISVVVQGADTATEVSVAAQMRKEKFMEFTGWLKAMGLNFDDLTENQVEKLQTQFDAEQKLEASAGDDGGGEETAGEARQATGEESAPRGQATTNVVEAADECIADYRAKLAAERRRQAMVDRVCAQHPEVAAKAIEHGWDEERCKSEVELATLRANAPTAPTVRRDRDGDATSAQVLEAALCQAGGLREIEATFDERTLQAAHSAYRGRLGIQELMAIQAHANGYHGGMSFRRDPRDMLRAAFSNVGLSGILGNTANKFLLAGFMSVESTWRAIAARRNVSDFKTVTSYRLTGGMQYEKVGPGGELKHATVGEASNTNQAQTYGKMFAVTRTDLINDDLGALTDVPDRLGRGAALKLNDVFWTAFLDNSSFFTSDNNNLVTSSSLGIDGLTTAEQAFYDQTDPDGNPLAIAPAILLVPNALYATAAQLMNSVQLRDTTSSTKYPTNNPHAGKFRVERSSYMSNSSYPGYSATTWYLLADPRDLAAIEVCFLNGVENPTVESADADFNVLGVLFRGYHDFGVATQDEEAAVKATA